MSILHFVSSSVWKSLFGKAADSLERSIDHTDEFMIIDYEPIASTFVSVPTDLGQLSADAYVSGIIAGKSAFILFCHASSNVQYEVSMIWLIHLTRSVYI